MVLLLKFTLSKSFLVEVYTTCNFTPYFTKNKSVTKKMDNILYRSQKRLIHKTKQHLRLQVRDMAEKHFPLVLSASPFLFLLKY